MEKIKLFEADIDVDGIIKKSADLKGEIEKLRKANKSLNKTTDEGRIELVKNEVQIKKLRTEYNLNQKQLVALNETSDDFVKIEERINQLVNEEVSSIGRARKNSKELKVLRDELNLSTQRGAEAAERINTKLNENTDFTKANVSEREKQIYSIGDYKTAIVEAAKETNLFGGEIDGVRQVITTFNPVFGVLNKESRAIIENFKTQNIAAKQLAGGQKALVVTTNLSTTALKLFRIALIGTGIGAIVVLLGSLVAYLSSTQDGIDQVTKVTKPLQVIFKRLFGVLQDLGKNGFEKLSEYIENPKKVLEDFGDFLKNQFTQRVEGIKRTLEGLRDFDLDKIGEGLLQTASGTENILEKVNNIASQTKDFISESVKIGQELRQLSIDIEKAEINLIKRKSELQLITKEQNRIAEDTTRNEFERIAAAEQAAQAQEELLRIEQDLIDQKIKRLKIEQSLNDTSRADLKELAELEAERNRIATQVTEQQTTLQNKLNTIRQQQIAANQKAIDLAINDSKTRLRLFIEESKGKADTLAEEIALAEEIRDKRLEILQQELEAKKKTETEFELESLQIKNEFADKEIEATIANAKRELEVFKQTQAQKIEDGTFFTQELLEQKQEELDLLLEKETEFLNQKKELGLLKEQEYIDALNALQEENRIAKEEAQLERDEAQREQEAIDFEAEQEIRRLRQENEFEIQRQDLERKRQQEIVNAQKTGADLAKINQKFALTQAKITQQETQARQALYSQLFGNIATLLGRNTAAGKAAAIAQATINTYQGITEVWKSPSTIPEPFGTIQKVASTGVVLASGLSAVASIKGTNARFENGGYLEGKSHAHGGIPFTIAGQPGFEAEGGEYMVNRIATAKFRPFLEHINSTYSVNGSSSSGMFMNGGILTSSISQNQQFSQTSTFDIDMLAQKIGERVGEANTQLPSPVVMVEDINAGQQNFAEVIEGANL